MRERVDLKSPVREYRPPGSVRGAPGNRRPYLDKAESRNRRAEGGGPISNIEPGERGHRRWPKADSRWQIRRQGRSTCGGGGWRVWRRGRSCGKTLVRNRRRPTRSGAEPRARQAGNMLAGPIPLHLCRFSTLLRPGRAHSDTVASAVTDPLRGASAHCPHLAGGPEFIPVVVVAGFC